MYLLSFLVLKQELILSYIRHRGQRWVIKYLIFYVFIKNFLNVFLFLKTQSARLSIILSQYLIPEYQIHSNYVKPQQQHFALSFRAMYNKLMNPNIKANILHLMTWNECYFTNVIRTSIIILNRILKGLLLSTNEDSLS